jgi:hypothetical protein
MSQAACRGKAPNNKGKPDTELLEDPWFPERGQTALANEAMTVCFFCPVRVECRAYRKHTGSSHGIWAGEYQENKGGK